MTSKTSAGHMAALITILIWGTTFISTKVLLATFTPIEILVLRFVLGYFTLWCVCPRRLILSCRKQEWYFAAAGLCGVLLYFLLENIALTFTMAVNVGVIVSISPFFTALFNGLFLHHERPDARFMGGFCMAMAGICLLSVSSETAPAFNPLGDLLAVAAAIIWAVYSTFTKKISTFGYNTIQTTRRTFFYGLVFMLPAVFLTDFEISLVQLTDNVNFLNILFLGLGASALCFVTWNSAIKILGAVKTSVYIYLVPVITALSSNLVLHEPITATGGCGMVLVLLGLFLSERKKMVVRT